MKKPWTSHTGQAGANDRDAHFAIGAEIQRSYRRIQNQYAAKDPGKLKIEDHEMSAHKIFLAAVSDYCKAQFSSTRLCLRTAMRCTCRPCIAHWKARSAIPESSLYVTRMVTAAYSMRADNDSVMADEGLFARILNTRIDWTTFYYTITTIPSTLNVHHGFAAPRALSTLLHPLTSLGFTTGEFIGNRNLSICFHYS